ncbi:Lrp/AsnC ligand binding domain-containing protein [Janthinobacterium sp. PSPC3-1]|uniref:Lrp/AsnC ligand binding domain-containing protein n=1 Tax=Janthinobacterium sp. PSPC3-1 TaxID=2804653 RepID=UPI003CEEBDDB
MLRIAAADLRALSDFISRDLLGIPGVDNVKSSTTPTRIKQSNVLPLDHVLGPAASKKRIQFAD